MKSTVSFKSVKFEKFENVVNNKTEVTWNVYVEFYEKIPYITSVGTGADKEFVEADVNRLHLGSRKRFIGMVLRVLDDLGDVYSAWTALAEKNNGATFSEHDWNNVLAGSVWDIETTFYSKGDVYVDANGVEQEYYSDGARWTALDIRPDDDVYEWYLEYGDYLMDLKGGVKAPSRKDLRDAIKAAKAELADKFAAVADNAADEPEYATIVEDEVEEPAADEKPSAKRATSRRK